MSNTVDMYSWSRRASLADDALNADQAEVEAIRQNVVPTAVSLYDERLAEELELSIDDPTDSQTRLDAQMQADVELDSLSGRVMEELARRADLLGSDYPFTLINNALVYNPTTTGVYEYCLAVSTSPNVTTGAYVELARYFEILSGDAVCHYLGEGSRFIRSGAPAYPIDAGITNFKEAIEYLHDQTGEWLWDPLAEAQPDLATIKDEGMDFVVWKNIDRRKGQIFILGQCACGRTDWFDKLHDLDFAKLSRWVRELPPVKPIRAFATPHNVTAAIIFSYLSRTAGLSFDRVRLTKIANSASAVEHFVNNHSQTLLRLTRLVISEARLAPGEPAQLATDATGVISARASSTLN